MSSPASSRAVERLWLDEGSWIDVARRWLPGADELYASLVEAIPWEKGRVFRYERWMDEPRLTASCAPAHGHPVLIAAHRALQSRYKVRFDSYALSWYRNRHDSVAFHRDRDLQWLDDTVIAILTLGAQRPWLVRPRDSRFDHEAPNQGATHDLSPASGDLIVLGGRTQVGWEHAVPKTATPVEGRISVQWRWTSRVGRQERGGSYRAPRTFSR